MDEILFLLLRKGAARGAIRMTTSEIGAAAGMSQQNASRRLAALEKDGYIERESDGIRLGTKAMDELAAAYAAMKSAFERGHIEIEGTIVSGLGEGKYYLSLDGYRKQIREKLGFDPFPGTLNIRMDAEDLWKKKQILQLEPIMISGFRDKERSYGDLFAYRCRFEKHQCALIVPLRTHHGQDVMEVICPFSIKQKLGKKDGQRARVVV